MTSRFEFTPALEEPGSLDDAATALGFVDRPVLRPAPKRKRGVPGQLHNFTLRVMIEDAEAFVDYCERERIPYREAFKRMLGAFLAAEGGR